MLFRLNNEIIEIKKSSFNTDAEFYEAIKNIMSKITNTTSKDTHIYKSTAITNLLKHNTTYHKN